MRHIYEYNATVCLACSCTVLQALYSTHCELLPDVVGLGVGRYFIAVLGWLKTISPLFSEKCHTGMPQGQYRSQ